MDPGRNLSPGLFSDKRRPRTKRVCKLALPIFCFLVFVVADNRSVAATNVAPSAFSFETVREQARALASREFKLETEPPLPDFLKNLTYDQYHEILFRSEKSPWQKEKLRFGIELFHRGFIFPEPVRIHLLESGQMHDFPFSPDQYTYGKNHFPKPITGDLGFAGFRLTYLRVPEQRDAKSEIGSFLGASYFRLVGLRQRYGSSFRGLAIDTGESSGEEFPRFKDFWIEQPAPSAEYIRCLALLDSQSCAGAYQFTIKPGDDTVSEMEASVFMRKGGKKIGLAPLTSMFLMGKNKTRFYPDFRPEVHDADGFLLQTAEGGFLWRPLANPPKTHRIQRFPAKDLVGFGLIQRERDFHAYEDLEARYELRPSLWVQTQTNWGPGTVELVEIPSPNEANDNMVAYWVPQEKPVPGKELHWTCRISSLLNGPDEGSLAKAASTRVTPAHDKIPVRFVVDFSGDGIPPLTGNDKVEPKLQPSAGKILNLVSQKNEATGGWRVSFEVTDTGHDPIELRLALQVGGKRVSESWLYHYFPE
jgi:glucans biosynthesis protein